MKSSSVRVEFSSVTPKQVSRWSRKRTEMFSLTRKLFLPHYNNNYKHESRVLLSINTKDSQFNVNQLISGTQFLRMLKNSQEFWKTMQIFREDLLYKRRAFKERVKQDNLKRHKGFEQWEERLASGRGMKLILTAFKEKWGLRMRSNDQ